MIYEVFYNGLVLPLLQAGLWLAKWFSPKIRDRESVLQNGLPSLANETSKRVLFHAPSMGELEQLLPIIGELKHRNPNIYAVVSCTSPSGYNHALKQRSVDLAVYLPVDKRASIRRFLESIRPVLIVIDRYDVWPNFVTQASSMCPVVLINATFPSVAKRPFLQRWVRSYYSRISEIVAVSMSDAQQLQDLLGRAISVRPDTRIDRVQQRIASADSLYDDLRSAEVCTLLIGSSWQPDEDLVIEALIPEIDSSLRLIFVPHEPTETALRRIESRISCTRLSAIEGYTSGHILVDSVGKLLSLYRIADAAFVGGGFGVGVHSTTEPAVYGIPVACGPHVERSRDATALIAEQLVRVVRNDSDVRDWLQNTVMNPNQRATLRERSMDYFRLHSGATEHYLRMIELLLMMDNKHC